MTDSIKTKDLVTKPSGQKFLDVENFRCVEAELF